MSQSLASAKKRRAPIQVPEPVQSRSASQVGVPAQQPQPMNGGLTLPQVIQLVDRRLNILEKFMSESTSGSSMLVSDASDSEGQPMSLKDIVEEFDKRYEMLAEEIVNLKNIVLSLQSYTMDVNKTLMEERVRIFSDLDASAQPPAESSSN